MKVRAPRWLLGALGILVALAVGLSVKDRVGRAAVETVTQVLPDSALQRIAREAIINSVGLRARLEGVREIPPDTIYVAGDTVRVPPDTVLAPIIKFSIEDGQVRFNPLYLTGDSIPLYRAESRVTSFGDCDEGLSIEGNRVICDPARFGHLYAFGDLGVARDWFDPTPSLLGGGGLRWEPSFRSPWNVVLRGTTRRAELFARREFRIW